MALAVENDPEALAERQSEAEDEALEERNQYVSFQVGEEVFAFPMNTVLEIIRLPETVAVPLTPKALLGLANLRGSVLPILDLRQMLDLPTREYNDASRVIVTDLGAPVGLVVDKVARVMQVEADTIDLNEQMQQNIGADLLAGVIKGDSGDALIQLLNVAQLIEQEFSAVLALAESDESEREAAIAVAREAEEETDQLVSFTLEDQEYAFNLLEVEEIVRLPEQISSVPRSDSHVVGLMDLRGRLLPLVSLRCLLDFSEVEGSNDESRILVISLKNAQGKKASVGLVVDDVKEVLRVEKSLQDAMPALLNDDAEGAEIASICRLDGGKRLVSVLRAESLFALPSVQAALEESAGDEAQETLENEEEAVLENDDDIEQLVVFLLGKQEYGVTIDDIQEITRVPETLDKVPKTAAAIEGMVNLRGTVLPVLDMRSRFEMTKMERSERQRIIVFSLKGSRTGFIVDSVAEVLRLPRSQIETAPPLSEDQARIMGRVINLKKEQRMIQVLSAAELLSDEEVELC
ncbi:MAG: chemotaxis protein CheW [Gammaproteobacteria bacterium]|nr:chemotaxis protein CheW [Gammaproteobacteria bacterium]